MSDLLPEKMQLLWLGHATFSLQGPEAGQRLLIDPFLTSNPRFPQELGDEIRSKGAFDALVVTHAHFDHFEDVVPLLENDPGLKIICPFEIGEWLQAKSIDENRIIGMNPGGSTTYNKIKVTMVGAIHSSSIPQGGIPYALGCPVGYVLRFPNGFTVYNTGDTAVTMDMQIVRDLYQPDLVILPIGDFYTMGAEQAAYALKLLQPRIAIGGHWQTWANMPPGSPEALLKEMQRHQLSTQLIQLKPGETLT